MNSTQNWATMAKVVLAAILTFFTDLLGGWGDALEILTFFIVADIVSGWIRAVIQKELSSNESFRGACKKLLIYVLVAVAVQVDRLMALDFVGRVVILFYCAGEGLSILENSVAAGLPVPEALVNILKQLREKKFQED